MIDAYLVDDEKPALDRLSRMLRSTERVEIVGCAVDSVRALEELSSKQPDVLFLDIHMPELSGFELLRKLDDPPLVVFTTAYDNYALKAFQENSVDYLLKPIESYALDRALDRAERIIRGGQNFDFAEVLNQVVSAVAAGSGGLTHLTSQVGQTLKVIDIADVTHVVAKDKLVYAVTPEKRYVLDEPIALLETKLKPVGFIRIHRGAILNLAYLDEIRPYFGGRAVVRLKNSQRTEVIVARSRVRELKEKLGVR